MGESYINNEFKQNLSSLNRISARNINVTYKFSGFFLNVSFLQNILNKLINLLIQKKGSKKNISFHYDLGNEFFSKWLDKTLTYSCGIFNSSMKL